MFSALATIDEVDLLLPQQARLWRDLATDLLDPKLAHDITDKQ